MKVLWFSGIGMVIVAGVVYLAANSTPKTGTRTLSQPAGESSVMPRCLSELATFGSPVCTQGQHGSEECSPLMMPPQIIDVCQPVTQWSIAVPHEQVLIPASAEEPVVVEDAEPIAEPISEETEETASPDFPQPIYSNEPEELAMPKVQDDAGNAVEEEAGQNFWQTFFGELLTPAQDEEYPGDDGDDVPMDEATDELQEESMEEEPACQEDPHRHEHYPVCPYSGRSYCPTVPARTPPAPQEEPSETYPKNQADPESPAQPGVDTMEYRPSDAKEGEFESKPM
jgi:hypothetical protein